MNFLKKKNIMINYDLILSVLLNIFFNVLIDKLDLLF